MRLKQDLKSKLVDGLLVSLVLVLTSVVLELLVRPLEIMFGNPGMLVYTVIVLALAMVAFEESIAQRLSDERQAAWGLISGLLIWTVINLSNMLGANGLATECGMVSLMLVGTVIGLLWRKVLPVGGKYGAAALLAAWVAHLLVYFQAFLGTMDQNFILIRQVSGFVAIGLAVLTLAWIWWESKNRFQRLWGALILWQCIIVIIDVFRGGLY